MYGLGKVDLVDILCVTLLNDYGRGNHHGEVVHNQLCEDFLRNVLHLFCVKIEQPDSIFQLAKGSFNSPA